MEILIQLLDEMDDIFSPLFAMASWLAMWRFGSVAGAAAVAVALNSPVVLATGLLLGAAGDAVPSRRSALAGPVTAE